MNRITKGSKKTTWWSAIAAALIGGGLILPSQDVEHVEGTEKENGQVVFERTLVQVPPMVMSDGGTITVESTRPSGALGLGIFTAKNALIVGGLVAFVVTGFFSRDDDVNSAGSGAEPAG